MEKDNIGSFDEERQLEDRLIAVNRVSKVVKGGRKFSFNALVAVGDGNGQVGLGFGKANDVSEAIKKGIERGKRNMHKVFIKNGTLPTEIVGHFGSGKILLKPAAPGTGIIAGGCVRAILEVAGVKNILTKCLGSRNTHNVAKATMEGLLQVGAINQLHSLRQSDSSN